MSRSLHRFRAYVWIALFAILMNALAPAVSHAMSRDDAVGADVCSAGKLAKQDAPAGKTAMQDCGYCASHGGSFGLAPAENTLPRPAAARLQPYLFYHSPRPLLALSAAPPRGPPASN